MHVLLNNTGLQRDHIRSVRIVEDADLIAFDFHKNHFEPYKYEDRRHVKNLEKYKSYK